MEAGTFVVNANNDVLIVVLSFRFGNVDIKNPAMFAPVVSCQSAMSIFGEALLGLRYPETFTGQPD